MSTPIRKLTLNDAKDLRRIINCFINNYYYTHREEILKHNTSEFNIYYKALCIACNIINPELAKNLNVESNQNGHYEIYYHLCDKNPNDPMIRIPPQSIKHSIPDDDTIGWNITITMPNSLEFIGDYTPENQKLLIPVGGGLYRAVV